MARKKAAEIVAINWNLGNDEPTGGYTEPDNIRVAAALVAAREAQQQTLLLRQIAADLRMLGSDGLHEILRHEAMRVRRSVRLKRARAAAKRKRTLAAKRAVQP